MSMRIRLTLDIDRHRQTPQSEVSEQQQREVDMGSFVERAPEHRIGFTAQPGRIEPDEWEDRR